MSEETVKFNYEMPKSKFENMVKAFCQQYKYQEKVGVDGALIDNPQSPEAFTLERVKSYIGEVTDAYDRWVHDEAAKAAYEKEKEEKGGLDISLTTE